MLSQEPGKGTVFLQDQQGISPAIPHHAALLCPGDVLTDMPASRNLVASRAAQQMASVELQPSRGASQTWDHHGNEPWKTFVLHQKPQPCHYRAFSRLFHPSTLLWLPTRISIAWLVVHQCSSPLCKVTLVHPNSSSKNLLSFSSLGPAARQHLGKVQLRQEMFVLQLQR